MQVAIKFTATGGCSAFGEFSPGDVARLPEALAKHLVEEARCAVYVKKAAEPVAAPEPVVEAPRKRKGR